MSAKERSPENFSDADIVARTVWGEARGEGRDGWIAVAWVIKNRAAHPGWWGRSLREVCLRPKQFSSWNFGDPNRQKMIDLTTDDKTYLKIGGVVAEVLSGSIPDPTGGAAFYHTTGVDPKWDDAMTKTAAIGTQIFYKETA